MAAMASKRTASSAARSEPLGRLGGYGKATHQPLTSLVFVLPFMAAYEAGVAAFGTDLLARNQIGQFLRQIGAPAALLPALLVVAVLLAWHVACKHPWRVRPGTLGLMYVESILWALPLLVLGILSRRMTLASGWPACDGLLVQDLLAGLGGGIYEEFLFRLVGLNLCTLIFIDIMELHRDTGLALAVALCSGLFGLYHFLGLPFSWSSLAFFSLAGAYLAAMYVYRGFGIAVGTHVTYNMLVVALRVLAA